MSDSKWEKMKKRDSLDYITIDEAIVVILGCFVFACYAGYSTVFIIAVIAWYWIKIRYFERKIVQKKRDIYNVYYDNCNPGVSQGFLERKTAHDRKPMEYDLEQLNSKRKFLVDKFVILNLILLVLIQLFIKE